MLLAKDAFLTLGLFSCRQVVNTLRWSEMPYSWL